MSKSIPQQLDEIEASLTWLQANLPERISGMEISPSSKIPFKVLMCRAAFSWRTAELSRAALDHLIAGRMVSSALLTRATVETIAGVWYLSKRMNRAVAEKALGNTDDRLMRLLMGSKLESDFPDPVHVNDFIESAEKAAPGFEEHYNRLSEFAHPNWAGTLFSFSRPEPDERSAQFGPYLRQPESIRTQCVIGLSCALLMFRIAFDEISNLMLAFTAICEDGKTDAV